MNMGMILNSILEVPNFTNSLQCTTTYDVSFLIQNKHILASSR